MPSMKVCIWNIQNYGAASPWKKYGESSKLRNQFIAKFLNVHQVDVLLVQEVARHGKASLVNLARTLNGGVPTANKDWVFSFCGSAFARDTGTAPTGRAELTFRTDARSEGYAVVWRKNRPRFSLLPALHDIAEDTWPAHGLQVPHSPLNLSYSGRPAKGATEAAFAVTGGYTAANEFPYEGNDVMDEWPTLVMPATSSLNPVGLQWAKSRRPANVVVRFANGALCPVSAYHAPSNQAAARGGARVSGLSRELYVVNRYDAATELLDPDHFDYAARTVMGGDYNYVVDQGNWPDAYENYTAALGQPPASGAACTEAPDHAAADQADRRTTVRLLQGRAGSAPVAGAAVNDYLTLMIDLAFVRPSPGVMAQRVNVVDELVNQNPNLSYRKELRLYMKHINAVLNWYRQNQAAALVMDPQTGPRLKGWDKKRRQWTNHTTPMFSGNWGGTFVDWNAFKAKMTSGHLNAARQAAEFYQIFISDHLPLVITIPDA